MDVFKPAFRQAVKVEQFSLLCYYNEAEGSVTDCFSSMLETKMWGSSTACSHYLLHRCVTRVYNKDIQLQLTQYCQSWTCGCESSAKIWKTMSGNWCKIRVNMPPFWKEDHVRMPTTKWRFDNCYEQMFTDSSLNSESGSNTHVVLNRLQSPSYQGHSLFQGALKSEHCWGKFANLKSF